MLSSQPQQQSLYPLCALVNPTTVLKLYTAAPNTTHQLFQLFRLYTYVPRNRHLPGYEQYSMYIQLYL